MPCWPLLSLLSLLAVPLTLASLILTLPERAVPQLLLFADHVAEFVERRHHVVTVLIALLARPSHLQILQHLLQFLQQPLSGILGTRARELLDAGRSCS